MHHRGFLQTIDSTDVCWKVPHAWDLQSGKTSFSEWEVSACSLWCDVIYINRRLPQTLAEERTYQRYSPPPFGKGEWRKASPSLHSQNISFRRPGEASLLIRLFLHKSSPPSLPTFFRIIRSSSLPPIVVETNWGQTTKRQIVVATLEPQPQETRSSCHTYFFPR